MIQTGNMERTLDSIVSKVITRKEPTITAPGIGVYRLAAETYALIATTPGALRTVLKPGEMIELHSHRFEAWYFTDGVAHLFTATEPRLALPEYAAIRVAPETVHGWSDVYAGKDYGVISHFHIGHGVHKVERVY